MDMTKEQFFFFFTNDFLSEIFGIDSKDYSKLKDVKSRTISVSEDLLKKHYSWENLLGRSKYYKDIFEKFKNKKNKWEREYNVFKEVENTKEISSYLNKYIQNPITRSLVEKGIKPQKYLQDRLNQTKPKIQNFYNAEYYGFQNIIVFETKYFHLSLHLKITQKLTKIFECMVIFSIWFEAPESLSTLNIEWINGINQALILGYELSQFLETNDYSNEVLFHTETDYPQNYNKSSIINNWVLRKPLFFITLTKSLLNINPINIFQEVASEVSQMIEICENFKKSKIQSPLEYYNNLNLELQDFLKRGKVLFDKADTAKKFISNRVFEKNKIDQVSIIEKSRKKSSLTPEILFSLFNLSYEKDTEQKKEDRGFRSLNKIYSEYGKEYNFSKQTVYNCFNDSDLEFRLENRYTVGKGGGKQYRIKRIELKPNINKDDDDQTYLEELLKIEEGLIYYNQEKYEKSLKLFTEVMRTSSKGLKENIQYYYGTILYIGKIYFQKQDYLNAQKYFEKIIQDNTQYFDVSYYLMLCYFKNRNRTQLQEIIDANIKDIYAIFTKTGVPFEEHKDLFKGKLTPNIEYARKFFINKSDELELKNFIIFINSKEVENRIRSYNRNEIETFQLNQNIIAYEKLRKTLAQSIIIKFELIREEIFKNILLNETSNILKLLRDFCNLINDNITRKTFHEDYFFDFLIYFQNHLEYYPIEFEISKYKEFVVDFEINFDLEKDHLGGRGIVFPNELRSISDFIGIINGLYSTFKRRREFFSRTFFPLEEPRFLNPKYKLEYILTQYLNIKKTNALKNRLEELTNKYNEVQNSPVLEIENLFTYWFNFRSPYSNPGIQSLQQIIYNAIDLIKAKEFIEFEPFFEEIQQEIDNFIKKINRIRKNGTKYSINKIFKILQIHYNPQETLSQIEISTTFKEFDIVGGFYSQIIEKLHEFLEEINGNKILRINFSNMELRDEGKRTIAKSIKSFWKDSFRLKILEDSSTKSIDLSYEALLDLGDRFDLDENLEAILNELISVISVNYNQLIIKSQKLKDKEFQKSIKGSLKRELENDFIHFEIENSKFKDEIVIKLNSNKNFTEGENS